MTAGSSPELADVLLAVRPARAYVVCATPRSGSTLLCEMLADSGIAGRPSEHVSYATTANGVLGSLDAAG